VSAVVGGLEVVREARVREDLGFELALREAASDVEQLAIAKPATPGPCTLILGADALLADGALGVWAPFVAQADAVRARQGLVRYRVGMPIVPDVVEEPLSIASDGALDGGLWSAPMDDEGSAIRRFTMIDRGVAVGLGMRAREAGLTRSEPNGGVRNLVVATGSWNDSVPGGRVIEVRRLDGLEIDEYTGEARLEVALALEHEGGTSRPIARGAFHLDLIGALARAKRSSIAIRRGPYVGPRAVLIDHAELIA
jgi:predicted Zn-dependent protease